MSDTRSPPLASSLPPGRRPWLPEGDGGTAGEGWRSPEAPTGHSAPNGRETRRSGRVLPDRAVIKDALDRRSRPASLLRPQRQMGRKMALGLVLLLAGAAGGITLGLSLRPGTPSAQRSTAQPQRGETSAAAPSAALPSAAPVAAPSGGGLPKTALFAGGSDARPAPAAAPAAPVAAPTTNTGSDVEVLRKTMAAEQARLQSLTQATTAAEAHLAQLQAQVQQREILARREAALAALPSVTAPLPNPAPRRAEPRAEQVAGVGSGTAPGGTVAPQGGSQRVVLHHRAGSYAASEAAGAMATQVREAGFDLNDTRAVTATPSQRVVRYFHAEDAPAAARLAGRLGRGWALQDFRSYEPLPSPGLLEVWLPDR